MYKTFLRSGKFCVYCGELAQSIDHFPPQVCMNDEGYELPCCLECNSLAGTDNPYDFTARVKGVKDKLKRDYKTFLKMPKWTFEEIAEFKGRLKDEVKEWYGKSLRAKRRVAWSALSYIASIDPSNAFVPTLVAKSSIGGRIALMQNSDSKPETQFATRKNLIVSEDEEFFQNCVKQFGLKEALKMMEVTENIRETWE